MTTIKSRKEFVTINAAVSLTCSILTTLLAFVSRTIFIYSLGKVYLGINGLFTDVLILLSFAELGIGNAMIYNLYKPVKENNQERIKSILLLYKRAYQIIGLIVLVLGLLFIPFLDKIIKGGRPDINEDLTLIYLFFLANTVLSYFFVYKLSIITAHQKGYIITLHTQLFNVIQTVLQIIVLLLFKNFILYLSILVICTFLNNMFLSIKAERLYPYIKEKAISLPKKDIKKIFFDVQAISIYKFASVILNGTTSIILSAFFSVEIVGIYANYMLFIHFFSKLISKVTEAFTASLGNLNTEKNPPKQLYIFKQLYFLCAWLFGIASVGLMLMHKDIITMWVGEEYVFSDIIVFALLFHFYTNAVSFAPYVFRNTLGLFVQGQIAPAIAAFLNIALTIFMGKWIGVSGVFLATAITRLLTMGIVDPWLIYHRAFQKSVRFYYYMYVKYFVVNIFIYLIIKSLLSFVSLEGWFGALLKCLIIIISYHLIGCILLYKDSVANSVVKAIPSQVNFINKLIPHVSR